MAKNTQDLKTIIIGMSGRMDSAVAAYLLKKQGHKCIGVGISFIDPNKEEFKHFGACQVTDLTKVQKVCEGLGLPFYAVNAQDQFKDYILDAVIAARLAGEYFDFCAACHALKIRILCEKAILLKADKVATGHYAKINFNSKIGEYQLLSALDTHDDQSYHLSRIDHQNYAKLLLPLGDMRRQEVERIALGLNLGLDPLPIREACFPRGDQLIRLIHQLAPTSLFRKGQIINLEDKSVFSDHPGIHCFVMGQMEIVSDIEIPIDPEFRIVHMDYTSGNIYLSRSPTPYYFNFCQLIDFRCPPHIDISRPVHAWLQLGPKEARIEGTLYFKNNNTVMVSFLKPISRILFKGQIFAVYKSMAANAPILGSGLMRNFGIEAPLDRLKAVREKEKPKTLEEQTE